MNILLFAQQQTQGNGGFVGGAVKGAIVGGIAGAIAGLALVVIRWFTKKSPPDKGPDNKSRK